MILAKIKNRYMFKSDKPDKNHDYAIYKDKSTNEIRAVELTHLYKPDNKRFSQLRNGEIKKMRFSHRETPSGVNNYYFYKNINGGPIDLRHPDINLHAYRKARISHKQSDDIKKFAWRKGYKKNATS